MHKITFPLSNLPRRYQVIKVLENEFRNEILVLHVLDELRSHEFILKASLLPLPSGYTCGALEERRRYAILGGAFYPNIYDQDTIQDRETDHKDAEQWGWFTMEKLGGPTLLELVRSSADISQVEAVLVGVIKAVHHAYKNNIVVRDLNPRNIFLTSRGTRLVDLNQSMTHPVLQRVPFLSSPDMDPSHAADELKPLPNCTIHDIIANVNQLRGSKLLFLELVEKAALLA